MKITLIALSAAALMATASAGFAQDTSSKSPSAQHHVAKKRHPGVAGHAPRREMLAKDSRQGPGVFGYAPPRAPMVANPDAGGGGGGGSGM